MSYTLVTKQIKLRNAIKKAYPQVRITHSPWRHPILYYKARKFRRTLQLLINTITDHTPELVYERVLALLINGTTYTEDV